ncbi:SDR family NAD(P)-dependent oxidoreductase [Myceligenerans pegani]|uniref:SDR family oxidoreductase n=1 Tax=Myceligenerans pegani TaxID=2776917 RepID=A0ABR9N3F5_9MICO|nr:SDR family oxidoreductase [Myceligenerans sp. TRM 65318]MBE1878195.1 SDR family oxidoreductase [Myceligenerans sp. TRM 65318]MBE3020466.1 SDR family oxidoreductase [Myceligenerans sp. TRM 65318]
MTSNALDQRTSNEHLLSALPSDDRLAGCTAIVTGSSSGIGEAIARVLAASGAHVVVTGRDAERAARVVDIVTARGERATAVTADLAAAPDELRDFARRATEALGGRVDILVNNAAVYPAGPTEGVADDVLDAVLATNIRAPHVLMAQLAPAMVERGGGVVVNIGSWMGRVGVPLMALYPATKAAIEQLTRAWAAEYGPRGVRVAGVAPGGTATPGNAHADAQLAAMSEATPAGVAVRPIDIARAVRYVVSDEGEFVFGATIDVDGGLIATRLR